MAETEFRNIDEMSFKEASIELEQIVRSLEAGDLELEESLARYTRGVELLKSLRERLAGVELLKSLRERLANAEQKVQVLMDASDADVKADSTAAPATAFLDD